MAQSIDVDKVLRANSLLKALRISIDGLREYGRITESHVSQFHSILLSISKAGIEVTECHIPDSELKQKLISSTTSRSGSIEHYSEDKCVYRSIFLTKLNRIINYLDRLLEEPRLKAGFPTSK